MNGKELYEIKMDVDRICAELSAIKAKYGMEAITVSILNDYEGEEFGTASFRKADEPNHYHLDRTHAWAVIGDEIINTEYEVTE